MAIHLLFYVFPEIMAAQSKNSRKEGSNSNINGLNGAVVANFTTSVTTTTTTETTAPANSAPTSKSSTVSDVGSGAGGGSGDEPRTGPYVDKAVSKNVTALLGKTAYLNCRVKNLGNKTVSECHLYS